MTWEQWVEFHAAAFGHRDPQDMQMLVIWARSFRAGGYGPDELMAASEWVVGNAQLKYRSDALAALQQRVKSVREKAVSRKEDDRPPEVECKLCYGCGWAMAPDPQSVRAGKYHEVVTCCRCPLGQWRLKTGDPRPSVELWDEYMPDWLQRRRDHEEQVRLEAEAGSTAAALDGVFGKLIELAQRRRAK